MTDLALLARGIVSIPLPRHFGAAQLRHALDDAGVDAVLADAPQRVLELGLGFARRACSPRTGLELLTRSTAAAEPAVLPPGTVKVTYTSGSTAEPKGVCLAAAALESVAGSLAAIARQLRIGRHLALLPLTTLLENVGGPYAACLAGATCHLPSGPARALADGTAAAAAVLAEFDRCRPESTVLVPELLRTLVEAAESWWQPPRDARFFAVGGARVSATLLERAAAVGLPVFEGYGLSECASVVCLNTPSAERRGSVGRPLPHARLRIDARGHIHVGGAVMSGYAGSGLAAPPAEIATGDLGTMDEDGFVRISGRVKSVFINSYGRNLSPEWIESELGQEAAIGQVAVFGEARPDVVAVIVPSAPGVGAAAVAIAVARANARLPPYARVARYHVATERFSAANGLLTGNGRPRREKVLERYTDSIRRLHEDAEFNPARAADG